MGVSGMTEEPKRQDKDAQESEESNRWDKIKGFFLDNPTLVLTLLYLYVTEIGIVYSASLYGRFGINIFDYSEIGDFLLSAFKNPITLIYAGAQVGVSVVFFVYNKFSARLLRPFTLRRLEEQESQQEEELRFPQLLKCIDRVSSVVIVALLALTLVLSGSLFPYRSATKMASGIKHGERPAIDVRYRSFSGSSGQVTEPNLALIGATQKAVFFYDVDMKRTIMIPQAQIVSIEVPK
jgi:hypothetical protein